MEGFAEPVFSFLTHGLERFFLAAVTCRYLVAMDERAPVAP